MQTTGTSLTRRRQSFSHRATVVVTLCAALTLGACSDDTSTSTPSTLRAGTGSGPLSVGADGVSAIPGDALTAQLDALPETQPSPTEQDGLAYMREEERLAEDVYRALGAKWNVPVFTNIAAAEATHTSSVKALLDRYQLPDPSAGRAAGSYQNATIAGLYRTLVEQGSASLVDALRVGAAIEELDIADLQARASTKPDIALVYANLEKGSRNHLRAFTSQLTSRGASYTPTHISQAAFDAIVAGSIEKGTGG